MSPDGSTKPPPEEKLLKLIRGKEPRAPVAPTMAAAGGGGSRPMVFGTVPIRAPETRWTTLAAGVFGVAFVLEALYLAVLATRPLPTVTVPAVETLLPPEPGNAAASPPTIPSLATSAPRALFASPVVVPTIPAPAPTRAAPSGSARLLASRLTLMGIVSGEPAQAIIEDSQTKKTYFVTIGQSVIEGAVLEQVLDNRVILDLDGEKIELTL